MRFYHFILWSCNLLTILPLHMHTRTHQASSCERERGSITSRKACVTFVCDRIVSVNTYIFLFLRLQSYTKCAYACVTRVYNMMVVIEVVALERETLPALGELWSTNTEILSFDSCSLVIYSQHLGFATPVVRVILVCP